MICECRDVMRRDATGGRREMDGGQLYRNQLHSKDALFRIAFQLITVTLILPNECIHGCYLVITISSRSIHQTRTSVHMTSVAPPPAVVPQGLDPAYYALTLLRRRRLDASIHVSTTLLTKNPYDQQVWLMKTRALTLKSWIDDTDMEEDGVAEVLLEDHSMASAPRPGTSIQKTSSGSAAGRPVSNSGRPLSGIARPGTNNNRAGSSQGSVEGAFMGSRPGTTRPVTTSGRYVRLGTASMLNPAEGGAFIDATRMDFKKYAQRTSLAKSLCDYILYVDHNPRLALELCAECTQATGYTDWWWKARLGKCYYQLGLLRDAEKQFKSSLKHQPIVTTMLELGKVYQKLDQPLSALDLFEKASKANPFDHHLLINMARIRELLNDHDRSVELYRKVLSDLDSSNVEAMACIAAAKFYEDQPEVALRLYRRLLQMGINTTELWNNLGLCCFYAAQYDMSLSCLERAMALSDDTNVADVWYNVGQVAIGIGDVGLAYQAFKITVSMDGNHAEAFNNLAILELRKGNIDQARNHISAASSLSTFLHEPLFNRALLHFKLGEFQDAYSSCSKALEAFPEHPESLELRKQLRQSFSAL